MQLVEQHAIDKYDPRYALIDEAAFKSKNLYNLALYEMRQSSIHERPPIGDPTLYASIDLGIDNLAAIQQTSGVSFLIQLRNVQKTVMNPRRKASGLEQGPLCFKLET